jgi:hypothetical protein
LREGDPIRPLESKQSAMRISATASMIRTTDASSIFVAIAASKPAIRPDITTNNEPENGSFGRGVNFSQSRTKVLRAGRC